MWDGLDNNMKKALALVLFLVPTAANAGGCEDLWFTRNLILDRAGYCFGSNLGKSIFDNADCIGKSVRLTSSANTKVKEIQEMEKQFQCKVNTRGSALDLEDISLRRRLTNLPIRDEFESGCIGWKQGVTALRSAPDDSAAVVGRIVDGDDVLFSHIPVGNWSYVTVRSPGWGVLKSGGWLGAKTSEASCRQWAG